MLYGEAFQARPKSLFKKDIMSTEIIQTLSNYIATQILKQPRRLIMPDEPLISNGLVDSFSLVDLSLFIEKTFKVYIDNTELNRETFDTLTQLAALIQSRM
jgi:acyl carrier protein